MARRRFGHAPRNSEISDHGLRPDERVPVGDETPDNDEEHRSSGVRTKEGLSERTLGGMLADRGAFVGIRSGASVAEAARAMAAQRLPALPVVEGGSVVGVLHERDLVRRVIARGRDPYQTPISEVMTGDVVVVSAENTPEQGLALLRESGRRNLLVIEGDDPARCRVLGLLSAAELLERTFLGARAPTRPSLAAVG